MVAVDVSPAVALNSHQDTRHLTRRSMDQNLLKQRIGENDGNPSRRPTASSDSSGAQASDDSTWGSLFWVTLVEPQTQTAFYACPATGQVSWDPPVGNFVLPPNEDGEWWELSDQSRDNLPYFYHTKTGETVWERPEGFVIPLGIIQETAAGRRLSQTNLSGFNVPSSAVHTFSGDHPAEKSMSQRSKSFTNDRELAAESTTKRNPHARPSTGNGKTYPLRQNSANLKRSTSNGQYHPPQNGSYLPPIPASPYTSGQSTSQSAASLSKQTSKQRSGSVNNSSKSSLQDSPKGGSKGSPNGKSSSSKSDRSSQHTSRSKSSPSVGYSHRTLPAQSLNAMVELLASQSDVQLQTKSTSDSKTDQESKRSSFKSSKRSSSSSRPNSPTKQASRIASVTLPGHRRMSRSVSSPTVAGRKIGSPVLNQEATMNMSPVKKRNLGQPILVEPRIQVNAGQKTDVSTFSSRHPVLPNDLASDIQQFSESDYAKQYFSTHRTGFIFRRRVPVSQMMTWQKAPLTSPLLSLNRSLARDAVKLFKVIQYIMGDRERERGPGPRLPPDNSLVTNGGSTTSLQRATGDLFQQERWLLNEGLKQGELRDEIFCQVMKQLSNNPSPESVFKGFQLLCVLLVTFPPSKNFETYLRSFIQQHTTHQEARVDLMAKHCLKRLTYIAKKGPRGKAPTTTEIETASDAAFNPSTFGESLGAIIRLQERTYPHQKIPIILPFLADGILALGGTRCEGIFRVPGDGDSISELKIRIDRGYYNLEGFDDPHTLASLMKLWMRELCDPLVPDEMYNECIENCKDPQACIQIVERLPTINRRVVLFVVSFLQLFLEDKIQAVTKMTSANLALVMAPNLLRCNSDSMAVVFTNAQYEQIFVYNLLLYLNCQQADPNYIPVHGSTRTSSNNSKPHSRRQRPS